MDPLVVPQLPRFPAQQASWDQIAKWWQTAVMQIEASITAINTAIAEIADAQEAASNAQGTADGAQSSADGKVDKGAGDAWASPTGTAARTTFATFAGQTISNPPTQTEVQAIDNHVVVLSQRMKALVDDLMANEAIAS